MISILVVGINSVGQTLARELASRGADVTVADRNEGRVSRIMSTVHAALAMDSTNRQALERLDIPRFDHCVVCISGEFEEAELTTLALRDLGAKHITAMASTRQRKMILETIGAGYVMTPGLQQARDLAMKLTEPWFRKFRYINDDQGMAEIESVSSLTIGDDFRAALGKLEVRFIGIRRMAQTDDIFDCRINGDLKVAVGDRLLFFGRPEDIGRMAKKKLK